MENCFLRLNIFPSGDEGMLEFSISEFRTQNWNSDSMHNSCSVLQSEDSKCGRVLCYLDLCLVFIYIVKT